MSSFPKFILYGTSGCHLCVEAVGVLSALRSQMLEQFGNQQYPFFEVSEVDIAESDELIDAFGTKIPVLLNDELTEQLNWPFDEQSVYQFMVKTTSDAR